MTTPKMATDSSTSSVPESEQKLNEVKLKMLTWNILGKTERSFPDLRNIVVQTVKQQLGDEYISFLQEIPSTKAVKEFPNFAASVITSGTKEAGVSMPNTVSRGQFNIEELELITTENLLDKQGYNVPEEYAERLYGRVVRISAATQPLLASQVTLLSYHARYKTEEKRKKTKDFFEKMLKLADDLQQTVIIGGDFNLSILDVKAQAKTLERNASGTQGRIIVVLYVATPRRWDNCIDTFAIVHPTSLEHRTECKFEKTVPIYPFPMTNYHKQESVVSTYPPHPAHPWFKFVDYSTLQEQKTSIEDILTDKEKDTNAEIRKYKEKIKILEQKIKSLNEELKGGEPTASTKGTLKHEDKKKSPEDEISKHSKKVEEHENKITLWTEQLVDSDKWLLESYTEEYKGDGPPAPLWPYSPLHKVLDHDPVVTTLKIKLRDIK